MRAPVPRGRRPGRKNACEPGPTCAIQKLGRDALLCLRSGLGRRLLAGGRREAVVSAAPIVWPTEAPASLLQGLRRACRRGMLQLRRRRRRLSRGCRARRHKPLGLVTARTWKHLREAPGARSMNIARGPRWGALLLRGDCGRAQRRCGRGDESIVLLAVLRRAVHLGEVPRARGVGVAHALRSALG